MTDIDRDGNEVELVPFSDIDEEDDETDWDDGETELEDEEDDEDLADDWLHDLLNDDDNWDAGNF